MELKKIDIKEFKKILYKDYKKLFPMQERKGYFELKKSYDAGMTDIVKVIVDEKVVGFFIANYLQNIPYLQLDYLAILAEYQGKGYGKETIKKLKEMYKEYDGIFIEVEKEGLGKTEEENAVRKRRINFYESLGFIKLGFDLKLFSVIYSGYMLPCKNNNFDDNKVVNDLFIIYRKVMGEKRVEKYCKAEIRKESMI